MKLKREVSIGDLALVGIFILAAIYLGLHGADIVYTKARLATTQTAMQNLFTVGSSIISEEAIGGTPPWEE